METDLSFVAPEGVYTVAEELIYPPNALPVFPTNIASVAVRFPARQQGPTPAFAQLLGARPRDRDDATNSDLGDQDDSSTPDSAPDLFAHPAKKRSTARPRHNIKTSSSTFITRIQTAEGLSRTLQSKQGDATFIFYNLAKCFIWVEAGTKSKEPLSKITFSAYPTCHDVNLYTASPEHFDIIIGFATGDLVWLDPISSRYGRLNKQGCITNSPCTAVRWVPASPTLFLVSHADGTIIAYDKEREDGAFIPPPCDAHQWDPTDSIVVTMPSWHPVMSGNHSDKTEKEKVAKNPVSHWRVSHRKIVDFVFSPDVKYVAAISEDGCLRVIDAMSEQLVDCYASYFGALTCVSWSPDGRFIITGGQDDLVTIFSPWEQRVVARCQGHSSFVSAVAFDELHCDGRSYRFGSVGEDNKLILWDFFSGALHRPKAQTSQPHRMSVSSSLSLAFRRDRSAQVLPVTNPYNETSPRYHPAPSRNEIAIVQPVLIKPIESDLLSDVAFLPRSVLTSTKSGHIKLWIRPLALKSRLSPKTRSHVGHDEI
ncbi:WD40-repeat-containing domain protein [Amanita rubescens]|nr:WD40-repeat-containing domain protein [Amanita rubescens]